MQQFSSALTRGEVAALDPSEDPFTIETLNALLDDEAVNAEEQSEIQRRMEQVVSVACDVWCM